jgi:O6-methylguanine-DNA--protein-cysteine methyltransferase
MDKIRQMQLLLEKIPKGKVTTYLLLAKKLKVHPRTAGRLLSMNPCPLRYPCFKVIRSDGSLGGYTSKRGIKEKVERLEKDGIVIKNRKIDLKKYLFKF